MSKPGDAFELDARIAFAAERTLLAWVRTALAMMGFGFVVARFGWLMQELGMSARSDAASPGVAHATGIALVVLGVATSVAGAVQHERNMKRLRAGQPLDPRATRRATVLAVALALIGLAMAGFLAAAQAQG